MPGVISLKEQNNSLMYSQDIVYQHLQSSLMQSKIEKGQDFNKKLRIFFWTLVLHDSLKIGIRHDPVYSRNYAKWEN